MSGQRLVVAIDGPAASGKSSTAQWVASELGLLHADSGALYRAATAARLRRDAVAASDWDAESVLEAAIESCTIAPTDTTFRCLLDGEVAEEELRGAAVTAAVSRVARMPGIRAWVDNQLRELAEKHDLVVDGRDIGSAVFPDASLKIFLIADPSERARRRLVQRLDRAPSDAEVAAETEELVRRDVLDSTQTVKAADAVLIDSTNLTQRDQVERIVALARAVREGS